MGALETLIRNYGGSSLCKLATAISLNGKGDNMTIATTYGNFGSFKDLHTFMRIEKKVSVHIESVDYWGINCIISRNGADLTMNDIEKILRG